MSRPCSFPAIYPDIPNLSDNFKVDVLPKATGIWSYVSFVTDLQAAAFGVLAFVLVLELREPPYGCPFYDCICSAGHWIEFYGRYG